MPTFFPWRRNSVKNVPEFRRNNPRASRQTNFRHSVDRFRVGRDDAWSVRRAG